jgi:SAM-dependent methyltransferase
MSGLETKQDWRSQDWLQWAFSFLRETRTRRILELGIDDDPVTTRNFNRLQVVTAPSDLAARLPLDSAWFDAVLSFVPLDHVSKPAQLINEAARVLKPGGLLMFQAHNRRMWSRAIRFPGKSIAPSDVEKCCQHARLDIISWVGLRESLCGPIESPSHYVYWGAAQKKV